MRPNAGRAMGAERDMSLAERTLQRAGRSPNASMRGVSPARSAAGGIQAAAVHHADPGLLHGAHDSEPTSVTFPFNLSATEKLLRQTGNDANAPSGRPAVDLGVEALLHLQVEVSDYLDNLDATLRNLFADPNAAVAKRLRETSDVPLTFAYFRVQQRMMRITGDLTVERERHLLGKLASMLSG